MGPQHTGISQKTVLPNLGNSLILMDFLTEFLRSKTEGSSTDGQQRRATNIGMSADLEILDDGQITHLIRVRLKNLLTERLFWGGGFWLSCFPLLFLSCNTVTTCVFLTFPVQSPHGDVQKHPKTSYDSKTGWAPIRCNQSGKTLFSHGVFNVLKVSRTLGHSGPPRCCNLRTSLPTRRKDAGTSFTLRAQDAGIFKRYCLANKSQRHLKLQGYNRETDFLLVLTRRGAAPVKTSTGNYFHKNTREPPGMITSTGAKMWLHVRLSVLYW